MLQALSLGASGPPLPEKAETGRSSAHGTGLTAMGFWLLGFGVKADVSGLPICPKPRFWIHSCVVSLTVTLPIRSDPEHVVRMDKPGVSGVVLKQRSSMGRAPCDFRSLGGRQRNKQQKETERKFHNVGHRLGHLMIL